jgi:hypothetical protein
MLGSSTRQVKICVHLVPNRPLWQRFPARAAHGEVGTDAAGTETDKDLNAMLYYHKIGTPQCTSHDLFLVDSDWLGLLSS